MVAYAAYPRHSFNAVAAALVFSLPCDYPSVLPELSIELEKGLGKKHHEEILALAMQAVR